MASLCVCLGLVTLSYAYVNIALRRPTYQLHQYIKNDDRFDASNAVDGLKTDLSAFGGQCVISQDGNMTAIWWVNLTSIHSIHHITIYYRTDNTNYGPYNDRFLGFSLFVSNTTNTSDGFLCFKDRGVFNKSTIPVIFNTNCTVHGQYVIYYNERLTEGTYPDDYSPYAHNELCEVEVYGCSSTGFYGVNCSVPCPDVNCQFCHIETGTCQGCKPGYQGHRCELDCLDGFFGQNCVYKCNATCTGCNNVNGLCDRGCHPGWQGNYCDKVCPAGYFGQDCAMKCPDTCTGCNNLNGLCDKGCHPGWKGDNCAEHCDGKMFGDNCSKSCGDCLGSEQCHHINGTCLNGCASGYEGELCTKECDANYFGINCKEKCNVTCKGCNGTTGICDTGCEPGWRDIYCHKACNQKTYGENCSRPCGQCLGSEQCHHINGTCTYGCVRSYQGLLCTECGDGFFGPGCNEMCNETCKGCNKRTGVCDNGCFPGWKGIFCREVCEFGYYGLGCNQECSTFCKRSRDCHHVSGYCKDGCKSGWQGLDCLEVSKDTVTEKKLTSEFNGILSAFCMLLFLNGVVITYFVVKRFRNSKAKQPAIYQPNIAQNVCESEVSNVYINEKNRSEYQELGEFSKPETYDTLQDIAYN